MDKYRKNFLEIAVALAVAALGNDVKKGMTKEGGAFTTYNYKGGVLAGTATGPTYSEGRVTVAEVQIDFAAIAAARIAAGQAAIANTDILQFIGVPAGTLVPLVGLQVSTVEGAALTLSVGDGTDDNGFLDVVDANALGRTASLVTTAFSVAVGGGKWYNVDDTIDLLVNTAGADVAVVNLYVPMFDLRKSRP